MSNRVIIDIAGQEFTMIIEDDGQNLRRAASYVDQRVRQVIDDTHLSLMGASVLTCLNVTEELFRALEQAENLRIQLKEYIEESAKSKNELGELRREVNRLKRDGK